MDASRKRVAFRSPRDHGLYVRVYLPPGFDETQYRRVDTLAEQVYEIANGTGPARFADYPVDHTGLVALMVAQKCCRDEEEWANVTDMGRALLFCMSEPPMALTERSARWVCEKKALPAK